MNNTSDEALVRDVQEGSITAFEVLVTRYQTKLQSFVTYLIHDPAAAQDVVQGSLINLYKTIDRVDTGKKFSSYLFSVTRNHAISFLRSRKQHAPLHEALDAASGESPEAALMQKDESMRIEKALDMIDNKYKKVISLYYYDNLSYEEIGILLKTPVNTVRTHLRRAKDALKKELV